MLEHGWIGSTPDYEEYQFVGYCECCGESIYICDTYTRKDGDLYCEHCMHEEDDE
jgi:hypothetical protein